MSPKRILLIALSLICLVASGTVAAQGGGRKVGERSFVYGETIKNDNLWTISRRVMPATGKVSQNQVMAAMLRRNPNAFSKGNLFYLRQGVVLTIPSQKEVRAEDGAAADALFADHLLAWKEARRPSSGQELHVQEKAVPTPRPDGQTAPRETTSATPAPTPSGTAEKPSVAPVASKTAPSDVSAAPALPQPSAAPTAGQPKGTQGGAERVEVRAPAPTEGGYLGYALGVAAALGILVFLLRGRKRDAATERQATAATTTFSSKPDVAPSMAGMETTRALERMEITQQVVAFGEPEPPPASATEAGNDARIKLLIAKAYLELKRDSAAHAILEEVLAEGNDTLRQEAEKLLGRWSNVLVAQEAGGTA